jgi:hypothetical protein
MLLLGAMLVTAPALAADFYCTGPQMGELFIDTKTGNVTKGAEETLTAEIATENSHYRFQFKGKKNQFKAIINRANGQIELDDACTPECWGGPIFGTCTVVKAKF